MRGNRFVPLVLVALLVVGAFPVEGQVTVDGAGTPPAPSGKIVRFNTTRFNDTLFTGLEPAYRLTFDERGDVWYSTQGGLVHVDVQNATRRLYTHADGMPSSVALGLTARGGKVFVGTDLGLAILDRTTDNFTVYHTWDSTLPDDIIREVVFDGDTLWLGTHFHGVATFDLASGAFHLEKNTSASRTFAKPVRRILPTNDSIWVGTDGDGLWRMDRATHAWTNENRTKGLPSNSIIGLATLGSDLWMASERGVIRRDAAGTYKLYNKTQGVPGDQVYDVDVVPTVDAGPNVFASTTQGLWQLDPPSGDNRTLSQDFGILGDYIIDDVFSEHGWAFGTQRGISLLRPTGEWAYYTTGNSVGASSGPLASFFSSGHIGDAGGFLWFGASEGLAVFRPGEGGARGAWYNLGEWANYPGGHVNQIDVVGKHVWAGTNNGVVGYNIDTDAWQVSRIDGVVYAVEEDHGDLWVPVFGQGLFLENLSTGVERSWTTSSLPTPLPDAYLTDLRIQNDDVWLGASAGVIRMNRVAGTISGTYTFADGLPGTGIVFRLLPDANVVWLGMKEGGVAKLDIATGKVTRVWNETNVPGFPSGASSEVRSLFREAGRLWAGTKGGLVRIDLATGDARVYNSTNSGLVQDYVNGISSQDGILYLATGSGVARFDIAADAFLPMQDGALAGASGNVTTTPRGTPVTVRIDAPRDGTGVTGTVEVRGSASRLGGTVDAVEVKIGAGNWTLADGTDQWSLTWNTQNATPNEPVTIQARARSGNDTSRVAEVVVTPVALPTIPLTVEHTGVTAAYAQRPVLVGAKVTGDEPLTASLYYRLPGADGYKRIDMRRSGALFTASIPAADVLEGTIQYFIDARSGGLLSATSPSDPTVPHKVVVAPTPRVAVDVAGPAHLVAHAGETTSVPLAITNTGTEDATFVIAGSGLRASWLGVRTDAFPIAAHETKNVIVTLKVPAEAFSDNTTLTFDVKDANGVAEPASATVPVEVAARPPTTTTSTPATTPVPGAPLGLALVLVVGLGLVLRRRSP